VGGGRCRVIATLQSSRFQITRALVGSKFSDCSTLHAMRWN
jgi:hypothetical protein